MEPDSEEPLARYELVPGLRNVDHVAFTVPDLAVAVEFFIQALGCQLIYHVGPTEDPAGDWMRRRLDVHPRASLHFAMLRCGPNLNMELYERQAPEQRREMPRNSDLGGRHLAFFVDDIEAAVDALGRQPGVRVLEGVEAVPDGPIAGTRWVYFLSPWGMQLELVCYEELPYQSMTEARQYGPAPSWHQP